MLFAVRDSTRYQKGKRIGKGMYSHVYNGFILYSHHAHNITSQRTATNSSFDDATQCVIKQLKPINMDRIKREVLILKNLQNDTNNNNNIIRLIDIVRSSKNVSTTLHQPHQSEASVAPTKAQQTSLSHTKTEATVSLIFEYIKNTPFQELYPLLTDQDVREYMFKLLQALDYSHSKGE